MSEPMLRVKDAAKHYGALKALDGVSFDVFPGEFVALLGPNGAGKTTLFQLLSGLFTADRGIVQVAGCDMARNPVSALAQLGIVFQTPALDLELTVEANLIYHARLHGIRKRAANARIAELSGQVGLADSLTRPARALSGGNRRRVELARALLHRPRLLLMDEATVGLDPDSRRALLAHVLELRHSEKLSALWATHLVDEATTADRIIILHKGRIIAEGSPADIIARAGKTDLSDAFLFLTSAGTDDNAEGATRI